MAELEVMRAHAVDFGVLVRIQPLPIFLLPINEVKRPADGALFCFECRDFCKIVLTFVGKCGNIKLIFVELETPKAHVGRRGFSMRKIFQHGVQRVS